MKTLAVLLLLLAATPAVAQGVIIYMPSASGVTSDPPRTLSDGSRTPEIIRGEPIAPRVYSGVTSTTPFYDGSRRYRRYR